MEALNASRIINNETSCDDKEGQIEFTMEFSSRGEFEEWLKKEKNSIRWSKKYSYYGKASKVYNYMNRSFQKSVLLTKQQSRFGKVPVYEWTETYVCPFAYSKRDYTPAEGVKRRKIRDSIKVGCKAKLKVSKKFDSDSVLVSVTYHTNHTRDSLSTWSKQRLTPLVREWMEKVVASGNDWNACKALLRPDEETLDVLESGKLL